MSVPASNNQFTKHWLKWLGRRLPKSKSTFLNQRRIFILPSRQGSLFLLINLVVFIGGINYANSLILAIAFTMISLFIVCKFHTYANLSGLTISAGRTENTFSGDELHLEILISKAANNQRSYQSIQLSWADDGKSQAEQIDLQDAQSCSVWLPLKATRRGYLEPPRLRVETRFPLGLLKAWTLIQLDQQGLVYPKPIAGELQPVTTQEHPEGTEQIKGQTDFDGLRGYAAGDNPRHIAWKQFARGQGLFTKAFVDQATDQVRLDWNDLPLADIEQRLSILTYWVEELSRQHQPFSLHLPGQQFPEAGGESHRLDCLQALALYGLTDSGAANG